MKIKALFLLMTIATFAHAGEEGAATTAKPATSPIPVDFTSIVVYALLAALLIGSIALYAKVRSWVKKMEERKRNTLSEQPHGGLKIVNTSVQQDAAVA